MKRSPEYQVGRSWVHAVLLNDPVHYLNRTTLRELRTQTEPIELSYLRSAEAMCGRSVRYIYKMPFHLDEDEACPDCKQLMTIYRFDPEQYPQEARRVDERVRAEGERRQQERERRAQQQRPATREVVNFLVGVDETDDDEDAPDLMELLRRDTEGNPGASESG